MPDYTLKVRVRNNKVERIVIYDQPIPLNRSGNLPLSEVQSKLAGKEAKKAAKLIVRKSVRRKVSK
jgi:hypothetical protein